MKKVVLLLALFAFTTSIFAQQQNNAQILVEGKSSVKLMPEEISFTVNLSLKDSIYERCADLAVEKLENIKALFLENGIDEELIKTNRYSIREIQRHDPQLRQMVSDGYEASIPLTIQTKRDYSKNDLIFTIIKENIESSFSLNFSLSDEQRDSVKEKLIDLAVQDARQKATIIAKSAEIKLGKVASIQYGEPRMMHGFNANNELMMARALPAMAADSKITDLLSPDEIEMRTEIIISWQISQ